MMGDREKSMDEWSSCRVRKMTREETKQFKKFEEDVEKMTRLGENCKYRKDILGIPSPYPRCTHPKSVMKVCAYLEDCPRRYEE